MNKLPTLLKTYQDTFALIVFSLPPIFPWLLLLTFINVLSEKLIQPMENFNRSGLFNLFWQIIFYLISFAVSYIILSLVNQEYHRKKPPLVETIRSCVKPYFNALIVTFVGMCIMFLILSFVGFAMAMFDGVNEIAQFYISFLLLLVAGFFLIKIALWFIIAVKLPLLQGLGAGDSLEKARVLLNGNRWYTLILLGVLLIPVGAIYAVTYYLWGVSNLPWTTLITEPIFASLFVVHIHNLEKLRLENAK